MVSRPKSLAESFVYATLWSSLTPGVYFINKKMGPFESPLFPWNPAAIRPHPFLAPGGQTSHRPRAFLTDPPPDAQTVTNIYTGWMRIELTAHPDAVVVMPLLNLDELYGPGPVGMNFVMQPILDAAEQREHRPRPRLSHRPFHGRPAVWNLAIHYPTYFAAINPMAGSAHDYLAAQLALATSRTSSASSGTTPPTT